jgi:Methylamine utilization protein MauJ
LTPQLEKTAVSLKYSDTKTPGILREATMTFDGSGGVLQRVVVETDEPDLSNAIRHINQIVADLLDALALVKAVPISIRHIDVTAPGCKHHCRYLTLPYGQHTLTETDFREAQNIPVRLRGAVRLFREGLSSSRPPYRLLCLYRVREVVEKVRADNDREIFAHGGVPTRPVRVLPANELTQFYFPQFVGKKVGAFLDYVRDEYRLAIAHGNLDEYFKLVLDPADVRIDHRIDFTNAALLPVVAELIRDEAALINLATAQNKT